MSKPSDGAPTSLSTRILLVDDHDIVREGLMALLSRTQGMTVVGFAVTGEEAVLAGRLSPDVIVMDLVLPALNGLDATRLILSEWPLTHIIALSACHTSEHVHRAVRAGARGCVTKASVGSDLVTAIKAVIVGDRYISAGIMPVTVEAVGDRSDSTRSCEHLSERGTGLGLAMVYGMAQRHGCTLEIDSKPGAGTTIRLIFPVSSAVSPPAARVPVLQIPTRSLRILVARLRESRRQAGP